MHVNIRKSSRATSRTQSLLLCFLSLFAAIAFASQAQAQERRPRRPQPEQAPAPEPTPAPPAEEKPAEKDRWFAVLNGRVHTVSGPVLDGVTILCRNGRIAEIGPNLALPEGCEQLDAAGHFVYPGLIAVRSQGIHMITRPLARHHALVLTTKAGRVFFIIPWRGRSLIGTTDTRYEGHPDEYRVTRAGLETFIGEVNEALPSANLTIDDVEWSYGGLRPIVENDTALRDVNKASRKYEIYDHKKENRLGGMLTVVGGKYTTSRALAERLTEIACEHLNMPRPSRTTAGHILPGGRIGSWAGAKTRIMREYDVHSDHAAILLAHYGTRALKFLAEAKASPDLAAPIDETKPEPLAVVDMAVNEEMALRLDDVLFRRTGVATMGRVSDATVDRVADRMAGLLGWTAEQRTAEVAGVRAKLQSRGFTDA